jgi:hypothetical protein
MSEIVQLILQLRGGAAFQRDMDKSTRGVEKFGRKTEETGKKTKGSWKNLAQFAGGAAALAGATRYLKGAAGATMDLGKNTLALTRMTGLSTEASSEWASVLKTRDINSKQFGVGMTKLSKQMQKAGTDSKTYAKTFKELGVSQDTVAGGDINSVIMQSADAFAKMTNPAQRAAKAQELFGKQGQALMPLLMGGSKGIREQLDLAKKYGATMSGKSVQGVKDMVAKQREMKLANEGLKVQIGQALLPAVLAVTMAFSKLINVLQPLLRNTPILLGLIGLLTVAFVTYQAAMVASTLAALTFNAAFLLIPIAIAAVIIGLVILYKRCGWFRAAIDAVWAAIKTGFNWIKSHWRLIVSILGGPFVAAALLIAKNWKRIQAGAAAAIAWIRNAFNNLVGFFRRLPARVSGAVSGMWNGLKHGADEAVHWVANRFRELIGFLRKIPAALKDALGSAFGFVTGMGDTVAGGVGNFVSGLVPGKADGGHDPLHGFLHGGRDVARKSCACRRRPKSCPTTPLAGSPAAALRPSLRKSSLTAGRLPKRSARPRRTDWRAANAAGTRTRMDHDLVRRPGHGVASATWPEPAERLRRLRRLGGSGAATALHRHDVDRPAGAAHVGGHSH